ncbi:MAG: YceD family protein [Acidimicrobiia bacterium]
MIRSPFLVDVSDLLGRDVPARPVVIDVVVDWALEMSKILTEPPMVADLSVAPIPGGILVRGEICYAVEHTCRRCLTDFVDDGCSPVAGLFETDPGEDGYPIEGTTIDLEPFLRDETLLGLPLLPICEESCEGVVTTAGIDLNTDSSDDSDDSGSPFAVLRDLLPPED